MEARLDVADAAQVAIRLMCRALAVSSSWCHGWRVDAPRRTARQAVRDALAPRIWEIFDHSKGRFGAPRIHANSIAQGLRIERKAVTKIVPENDIRSPRLGRRRRVPRTADSWHTRGIAPKILPLGEGRDF